MAVDPVDEPPQRRARAIFADGQGGDVAGAAPREIARGGVMHRMVMAPEGIGGERQHADDAAQHVVRPARLEIGAVAAIMLDDEEAHQEGGGRQNQDQRRPDLMGEAEEDSGQKDEEGQGRAEQIENAAPAMRPRIGRDQPAPARRAAPREAAPRGGPEGAALGGSAAAAGFSGGDRARIGRETSKGWRHAPHLVSCKPSRVGAPKRRRSRRPAMRAWRMFEVAASTTSARQEPMSATDSCDACRPGGTALHVTPAKPRGPWSMFHVVGTRSN